MNALTDARLIIGRQRTRRRTAFLLLSAATLVLMIANLRVGTISYSSADILKTLWSLSDKGDIGFAVWKLRIPRTLGAAMGGAYLAAAGLLLQVYFRNPIVEPFILGVSSGANLMVSMVMLTAAGLKLSYANPYATTLAGCAGALMAMALVTVFAARVRSESTLLVVGLMIGYVCSSATSIVTALAERERIKAFLLWGLGSFAGLRWTEIAIMAVLGGALTASVVILARPLNAFLLGEDYAASMGVHVKRFRIYILLTASALAGLVTSMTGPVAFIGLAVPHLARLTLGTSDNRILVPGVCLTGAAATTLCDMVARMWLSPVELPVSAITAIIGGPVVITLLLGRGRRG
jgi:iron complex transport system permease protein